MFRNAKPTRDAFAFSLGGIKTVASFGVAPVVADDRINRIRDERLRQARGDRPLQAGPLLRSHRPAAQSNCA